MGISVFIFHNCANTEYSQATQTNEYQTQKITASIDYTDMFKLIKYKKCKTEVSVLKNYNGFIINFNIHKCYLIETLIFDYRMQNFLQTIISKNQAILRLPALSLLLIGKRLGKSTIHKLKCKVRVSRLNFNHDSNNADNNFRWSSFWQLTL